MNAAVSPIEVYLSSTVVSTWPATNTITSRDRLRCKAPVITRGIPGSSAPAAVATPSNTVAVSRTSAMTPVARVAYQSGLTVPVTAQEPPDDVTGAAGGHQGGGGGGRGGGGGGGGGPPGGGGG